MIKPRTKLPTYSEHDNDFMPTSSKAEILICEQCTLPASKCKGERCERYNALMKEIKAKRKTSKRPYRSLAKDNFM